MALSFALFVGAPARNIARVILAANACLLLLVILHGPSAHADGNGPLFQQGLTDRGAWEQWFSSLQGDFKTGAFYWAGQRSLPQPGSCRQMNDDFFHGCTAAKMRLAPADAMRRTEPDYKTGWNAWTPTAASPPAAVPAAATALLPARPPVPVAAAPTTSTDISEEQFIAEIDKASAAYSDAPNEMAQGAVRAIRARALAAMFPNDQAHDWVGTIETLSSTNDGRGILAIRISPHITLSTINNSLSESLASQKTLLAVGSSLWSTVVGLREGAPVRFSGRFSAGPDYFQEISLTVGGGMSDPDFIMRFFAVAPITN